MASLMTGESVPETTVPTAAPAAFNTGVSARTMRRSPVLKKTIFLAGPFSFSALSTSEPMNGPLSNFTTQPSPAAISRATRPMDT